MNTIGGRIRELRKSQNNGKGINQSEFAEKLGLKFGIISLWELDKLELDQKTIKAICYTFNINENWLRTGEGDMLSGESPEEQELLELFRNVSPETRKLVLDYVRLLLRNQQALQPPAP
jgi:transcriptional regulator with XRE-family HTH domain